jgi:hypothetical protein
MASLTILLILLLAGTIGLMLYRKLLAPHEDDLIHVGAGEERLVSKQAEIARKLDAIDRWVKILAVAALIVGLAIAVVLLYQGWVESRTLGG